MIKLLTSIDKFVERFTLVILVISVFFMLTLSVFAIIFRWFSLSFMWIEPLVRHLVFLSAFLGGVIAAGRGTHISIDVIGKYIEARDLKQLGRYIGGVTALISFLTICWLIKASYDFMLIELQYGKLRFFNIHSGYLVGIIPFGFSLIAYRFFYKFVFSISKFGNKIPLKKEGKIC